MPRKTSRRASTKHAPSVSTRSFLDYIRSGESYTSLILGIVVVIIASILLISFFRNRGERPGPEIATQNTVNIEAITGIQELESTPEAVPTLAEEVTVTPTLTQAPTPTTVVATPADRIIPSPTPRGEQVIPQPGRTYTVKAGDTLWSIAESQYKSGYNWVDIAKENKLTQPDQLAEGMKLTLPQVKRIVVDAAPTPTAVVTNKITSETYKVSEGDFLWDIAVRRYGDGYKWVEIARVNSITAPDVIQPGTVYKLPRL